MNSEWSLSNGMEAHAMLNMEALCCMVGVANTFYGFHLTVEMQVLRYKYVLCIPFFQRNDKKATNFVPGIKQMVIYDLGSLCT